VRLGGEVDDGVGAGDRLGDRAGVLDRAAAEGEPGVVGQVAQVLLAPRVRELVQDDDLVAVLAQALAGERRPDEPGPPADEQPHAATPDRARCAR
jgi:hypothetical protein